MREACSTCRRSSNSHVCRECVLASRPSIEFQLQFDAQNVSSLVALNFLIFERRCVAVCAARRAHRHGTARAVAAVASRDTATSDVRRHVPCMASRERSGDVPRPAQSCAMRDI